MYFTHKDWQIWWHQDLKFCKIKGYKSNGLITLKIEKRWYKYL